MHFHVIDQNYLREDDLANKMTSSESGEYFVITDAALIEMTKSSRWENVSQQSLQVICNNPDKILVSESTPDIIRKELSTKRPTKLSDLFSSELTESFRDYLREFRSQDQSGPLHFYMANAIKTERLTLDVHQLNHSRNLSKLQDGCKELKKSLNAVVVKLARKGVLSPDALKDNICKPVLSLTALFLKGKGFSEEEIIDFLMQDSFILRYQIAFTMLCLYWISYGGLESLPAEKATNEIMDMDYALIASYGGSILSEEPKVHRQLSDLQTITSILLSEG